MPDLRILPIIVQTRIGTRPDIEPTTSRIKGYAPNGGLLGECVSIEPAWRQNRRRVSCIPPGIYRLKPRTSPKFGKHLDVIGEEPQRSVCLWHAGNDTKHTQGCTLPGLAFAQLDSDAATEVTGSRTALAMVRRWVGAEAWLIIVAEAAHRP